MVFFGRSVPAFAPSLTPKERRDSFACSAAGAVLIWVSSAPSRPLHRAPKLYCRRALSCGCWRCAQPARRLCVGCQAELRRANDSRPTKNIEIEAAQQQPPYPLPTPTAKAPSQAQHMHFRRGLLVPSCHTSLDPQQRPSRLIIPHTNAHADRQVTTTTPSQQEPKPSPRRFLPLLPASSQRQMKPQPGAVTGGRTIDSYFRRPEAVAAQVSRLALLL